MAEVKSRTQGSRPRSRRQKNPRPSTHLPMTDPLEAKYRIALGQGQGHSAEVFSKKKVYAQNISYFSANFRRSPKNKKRSSPTNLQIFTKFVRQKFFFASSLACSRRNNIAHDIGTFSTGQKIVLSSSRGQGIFED